jgi:hypothetical protein
MHWSRWLTTRRSVSSAAVIGNRPNALHRHRHHRETEAVTAVVATVAEAAEATEAAAVEVVIRSTPVSVAIAV